MDVLFFNRIVLENNNQTYREIRLKQIYHNIIMKNLKNIDNNTFHCCLKILMLFWRSESIKLQYSN